MNKADKLDLIKGILRAEVPAEALNPPKFAITFGNEGGTMINGKRVDLETFHKERERLHVSPFDVDINIEFRNNAD